MNSRIKLSARAALSGSQAKIIPYVAAITILIFAFSVCNSAINFLPLFSYRDFPVIFSGVSLLLSVALVSPLRLRLEIKHLLLARGINPSKRIDMGISGVLKACEMAVCLFFIKLFWLAVFEAIPLISSAVFVYYNMQKAVSLKAAFIFFSGMIILAVAGFAFYLLYTQRYSKSMFYLACYKDFTVAEAISESIKRTKEKCADILLFKLGFAPWFLLCLLIFPVFFVVPYYKQSVTCLFLSR
ncbi:MAG: hypothetical protein IKW12_02345 [Clostridia bacterium]|nr:hypothetical protein [Clostridia bacterium]